MKNSVYTRDLELVKKKGFDPVGWVPMRTNSDGQINPHATSFCLGDTTFLSVFHVKPVYFETRGGAWRPLSEITSKHGNREIVLNRNWVKAHPRYIEWLTKRQSILGQELKLPTPFGELDAKYASIIAPQLSVGLTTTTVYPDPDPETTTVDGYSRYSHGTYSTCQSSSTGNSTDASSDSLWFQNTRHSSLYYVSRIFALFDTSTIGSDTISSGSLSLYYKSTHGDSGDESSVVVSSTPASNTAIVHGDFDQVGTTEFGSINLTDWSTSAGDENSHTLNASGLAHINKSGVSKFGVRTSGDISATSPGTSNAYNRAECYGAENASGYDPKLVVIHSAGAAPSDSALSICNF